MKVTDIDILIVGGGPAGVAAACTLAESARSVLLCDQASQLGGAIHRQLGANCLPLPIPRDYKESWQNLQYQLDRQSARVQIRLNTIFVGQDSTGIVVLKDHIKDRAHYVAPKAVVFATGAYENIRPVPGWHLPGVVTTGGLQVNMKSAGIPPAGRILLAGTGPLLLTVAAQLAALGNAPIAVVESGKPLTTYKHWLGLPIAYLREGFTYFMKLQSQRVPWICGMNIEQIQDRGRALSVTACNSRRKIIYDADLVALHDGVLSNNTGLPVENLDPAKGMVVVLAGDCDEVLGARAAPLSGRHAALRLLAAVDGSNSVPEAMSELSPHRRAQAKLEAIFNPANTMPMTNLPDETILCRCEQKTVGDLRHMLDGKGISAREIKLNGRFGMGRCQGRFCGKWVLDLLGEVSGIHQSRGDLTGRRWPVRPISIRSLAGLGNRKDIQVSTSINT